MLFILTAAEVVTIAASASGLVLFRTCLSMPQLTKPDKMCYMGRTVKTSRKNSSLLRGKTHGI